MADEVMLIGKMLKSRVCSPTKRIDFLSEGGWFLQKIKRVVVSKIIENLGQFSLQIPRKNRVCDGPTDNSECFSPPALGVGATHLLVKSFKDLSDKISVAITSPTWRSFGKSLPVFFS
ncbi:MAG TPA: hypothetical protein VEV41_16450 [Terriglobales bacterium]|nr:hypothetical protein [Terriglobales bacterium]